MHKNGDYMFCEKCGRILKDSEYVCPECGRVCREPPVQENTFTDGFGRSFPQPQPMDIRKALTSRIFIGSILIGIVAGFAITYIWRFSFLMFCVPLFVPSNGKGIGLGLLVGMGIGSIVAMLVKALIPTEL